MRAVKVKRDASDKHPNTGPCQRCWELTAPRYGDGFTGQASPFCATCKPIVEAELQAERDRQRTARNV